MARKHFNASVDRIEGTVKSASSEGVELEEYPGRTFRFSSLGMKMADLVADELGRRNEVTRAQAVREAPTEDPVTALERLRPVNLDINDCDAYFRWLLIWLEYCLPGDRPAQRSMLDDIGRKVRP